MLKLNNLRCTLTNTNILDIEKLEIFKPGLYVLLGPSGCGKTTFLNIISGLNLQYSGKLHIFNRDFQKIKEKERVRFRASHLSVFFQHNVFLEELDALDNISLASLTYNESLLQVAKKKGEDIAQKLGISHLLKQKIKTLSGGEKTRVALARTLLKEVPLYLFDEPTAALDNMNAINVMNLIKEKSRSSIVLLVTHDQSLAREFADKIFTMSYGRIVKEEVITHNLENENKSIVSIRQYEKNSSYIAGKLLKAKKVRHFMTAGSVNIGIIGLGLSLLLVSAINTKLVNTFRGVFDEKTAYIAQKNHPHVSVIKSVPSDEINEVMLLNNSIGGFYLNDFDTLFPSQNTLSINVGRSAFVLPSFHIGLFNEPIFINEFKDDLSPYVNNLEHDEVALVLPYDDYKLMQNVLRLPFRNSPIELGNYLANNEVILTLEVANKDWDFMDEQTFRLKSVSLGNEPQVILGNPGFVSRLFEDKMMLPSSLNLMKIEEYPWVLKKINYVFVLDPESFLWSSINYPEYVFYSANNDYFRYLFNKETLRRRIFVFETPQHFNDVLKENKELSNISFYTFSNGLTFIPEMMLLGYANNFFIADDSAKIEELIAVDKDHIDVLNPNITMGSNVMNLAIQYNGFGSFAYEGGNYGYDIFSLGISSGLAIKLFNSVDVVDKTIHVGVLTHIEEGAHGYDKHYQQLEIRVKEVISNDEAIFYHHPLWSYLFFKDILGINPFSLMINGAIVESIDNNHNLFTNEKFVVSHPFDNFKKMINETLNDLERYTLITAIGAFLLSGLIIFMVIYLLVAETADQFSGLFLMGYSKKAIHQIISNYIIRFFGVIIFIAIIELFIFSFVIEYALSSYLLSKFSYNFNFIPYAFVLFLAGFLLFLLLNFFEKKMKKIDLLQFSKRDL